jgi:hypothetical protein
MVILVCARGIVLAHVEPLPSRGARGLKARVSTEIADGWWNPLPYGRARMTTGWSTLEWLGDAQKAQTKVYATMARPCADTQIRRYADAQMRRCADAQTRRRAD